jgi:hypothetical protein
LARCCFRPKSESLVLHPGLLFFTRSVAAHPTFWPKRGPLYLPCSRSPTSGPPLSSSISRRARARHGSPGWRHQASALACATRPSRAPAPIKRGGRAACPNRCHRAAFLAFVVRRRLNRTSPPPVKLAPAVADSPRWDARGRSRGRHEVRDADLAPPRRRKTTSAPSPLGPSRPPLNSRRRPPLFSIWSFPYQPRLVEHPFAIPLLFSSFSPARPRRNRASRRLHLYQCLLSAPGQR